MVSSLARKRFTCSSKKHSLHYYSILTTPNNQKLKFKKKKQYKSFYLHGYALLFYVCSLFTQTKPLLIALFAVGNETV